MRDPSGLNTVGLCGAVNGTLGVSAFGPSACLTGTLEGPPEVGIVSSFFVTYGLGANLDASLSFQVSNATHLQQLAGPFFYVTVNADWVEGGSITLFWSPDVSVYGAEFGPSGGAGAEVSAGLNYTHVDTFGGIRAAITSDVRNNIKPNISVQCLLNSVRTMILNRECGQ
jgi:hypothetical protein